MRLKVLSAKRRPSCLGLNVLSRRAQLQCTKSWPWIVIILNSALCGPALCINYMNYMNCQILCKRRFSVASCRPLQTLVSFCQHQRPTTQNFMYLSSLCRLLPQHHLFHRRHFSHGKISVTYLYHLYMKITGPIGSAISLTYIFTLNILNCFKDYEK